mgnify:CR=1 FL=1
MPNRPSTVARPAPAAPRLVAFAAAWLYAAAAWAQAPAADLPRLAEAGDFGQVAATLKADDARAADPAVAALLREIDRYEAAAAERTKERQEAIDKARGRMNEAAAKGRLLEAVFATIDAHSLSTDKPAFLAEPAVAELVRKVEDEAKRAEDTGDWLEALNFYRALNLLFDDHGHYRDATRRAAKHVRVLRYYAPKELERLLELEKQRRAQLDAQDKAAAAAAEAAQPNVAEQKNQAIEEAPKPVEDEPINLQGEDWQARLKGIEVAMLRQTLAQAARRHIADRGYTPLVRGALHSLKVLCESRGLEATFPAFADAAKVQQFAAFVREQAAVLDQPNKRLNFLDAATLVDKVMVVNDKTLQLPESVIVYEMTEGATDTLDDFSAVIWPDERENFSRNTQGRFFGVGIQISRRDGRLVVVSPLEGTPAQRAGVKAGDIIAKVNDRDTSTWTLDQAVREITGPEGTFVSLGLERVGSVEPIEVKIQRAEIVIESIKGWEHKPAGGWDYYIDPDLKIGYVRLTQFIPQTADDLDAAINAMQEAGGVRGLILDLRFNPGGLLSSAVQVVDRFVDAGPIVFTVDSSGQKITEERAARQHTYPQFPVVVLINQGSASASEIVSGALQDYGRARIVGVTSFGKGSVQDLFPLDAGKAYLKLTTQYYKLPQGRIIHREPTSETWGVQPDLEVLMTDRQVADAIEFRQEIDVLRDPDAPAPAPAAEGEAPAALPKAADILARSMDPQLEAGLLVLKTRLIAQEIAVAQKDAAPATP